MKKFYYLMIPSMLVALLATGIVVGWMNIQLIPALWRGVAVFAVVMVVGLALTALINFKPENKILLAGAIVGFLAGLPLASRVHVVMSQPDAIWLVRAAVLLAVVFFGMVISGIVSAYLITSEEAVEQETCQPYEEG